MPNGGMAAAQKARWAKAKAVKSET